MQKKQIDFVQIRQYLHTIPEVGYNEHETSKFLKQTIDSIVKTSGRKDIKITSVAGTGWVVYIPGKKKDKSKTIGYRADIDGLQIKELNTVAFKSKNEGFGHLCGHDCHMTFALGLLDFLVNRQNNNNYVILFQPAEEGGGGGKKVYGENVLQKYKISEFYACHVSPNFPLGTYSTKEGQFCAGAITAILNFTGVGSHSSQPQDGKDAMMMAANYIINSQSLVSRFSNPLKPLTINSGILNGTGGPNTITAQVDLVSVIRYPDIKDITKLESQVNQVAKSCASMYGGSVKCEFVDDTYLPVYNDPKVAEKFITFSKKYLNKNFVPCDAALIGEDFGYLTSKYPATMFWVGVGNMGDKNMALHNNKFLPPNSVILPTIKFITSYFEQNDII